MYHKFDVMKIFFFIVPKFRFRWNGDRFLRRGICVGIRKCRGRTGGPAAEHRADAFFRRKRPHRKKTPSASARPRVRFRSDGSDGSTGTAGPRRSTLKHCEAATPGKRERERGAAASGLSPQPSPHSLRRWRSEESSEVVSLVSHRIDYGLYSSRFPRGPPIRAPLRISG